jgi:DNA-binding winged helix-turn-helix (wHTH) protein
MHDLSDGSLIQAVRFGPANSVGPERGAFQFNPETLELRHHGEAVALRPQAARALVLLLRHEGELVTNDELRRELWGERHLEWRNSLHQCVRDLRRALADGAARPRFVGTVARRGYRFIGDTTSQADRELSVTEPKPAGALSGVWRRPSVAFVAGATTFVLLPISVLMLLCAVLAL